jgi:hypothetical protein
MKMGFFKKLFKGNQKKARDDERDEREDRLEEYRAPEKTEKPARVKRARKNFRDTTRKIHLLIPIGIGVVALFLLISLFSRNSDGLIGPVGKAMGDFTFGLFGFAAYFLPPILLLRAARWRSDIREKNALFASLLSFFFLIFQICIRNSRTNRIRIRVFMSYYANSSFSKYRISHFFSPKGAV